MARVTAEKCGCGCRMKRLYTRAEGGKGWDSIGWMCSCGCGCVTLDAGPGRMNACCSKKGA